MQKNKTTLRDLTYKYDLETRTPNTSIRENAESSLESSNSSTKEIKVQNVIGQSHTHVPQVTVRPKGEIILDQQSLIIDNCCGIRENADSSNISIKKGRNLGGIRKIRQKSKMWTNPESLKFYKALKTYGTDFTIMQLDVFSNRTRDQLKTKFKREERINLAFVDKVLRCQKLVDDGASSLIEIEEEKLSNIKKRHFRSKKKRMRRRIIAEEVNCDNDNEWTTRDSINIDCAE